MFVPPSTAAIDSEPGQELHEMGARYGGNAMPVNTSAILVYLGSRIFYLQIHDIVAVEVDYAAIFARQALEQFSQNPFRAMLSIDKRRYHRQAQVSESSDKYFFGVGFLQRIERKARAAASGTIFLIAAKDRY